MTGGINQLAKFPNWVSGGLIPKPSAPVNTHPVGGSQSIRDALFDTVGRTEPQTPAERAAYQAGGAVAQVPLAGLAAPESLATALIPTTGKELLRAGTLAAGSGAGGSAARDEAGNVTKNPWLLAGADTLGSVLAGGGAAAALAVSRMAAQMARPLTSGGQQTIAGRILNQAAGNPEGVGVSGMAASAQPAGVTPTLGDLTGNRGLQTIQRAVESSTPEAGQAAQGIATNNNQQIRAAFNDVGQPGQRTPEQISEQAMQRLVAVHDAQHEQASNAFNRIDPNNQAMVPTAQLNDRYADYVTGLTAARRRSLPNTYGDLLAGYGEQEPLRELQDFASTLKTDTRQAGSGASPDYNKADVLSGLHDALFPEGGPEDLLVPGQGDVGDAMRAARDQWRNYRETYTEPTAIKNALRPGGTPASAAFDRMLGSTAPGQTERVGQFLAAAQGDPELLQAGRDWFAAKMRDAGEVAGKDQQGAQLLNGNQLRGFAQDNQPLIGSDLFSDQHRQAISDILDGANMVGRTARAGTPGGSDTFRQLATGNYLRSLGMSPLAAAISNAPRLSGSAVGVGLGAHIGALFGSPSAGAIAGAPIGAQLGNMLSYERPRANVLKSDRSSDA